MVFPGAVDFDEYLCNFLLGTAFNYGALDIENSQIDITEIIDMHSHSPRRLK